MPFDESVLNVFAGSAAQPVPTVIGVPFPRGAVTDPKRLVVVSPGGAALPTGTRAIASWPDGSSRWVVLSFAATEKGRHRVVLYDDALYVPEPPAPVRVTKSADGLTIDSGLLR